MASQRMMPLYVWLYCIVWWFVQDWIKVLSYVMMEKLDMFSYRTYMDPDTPAVAPTKRAAAGGNDLQQSLVSRNGHGHVN